MPMYGSTEPTFVHDNVGAKWPWLIFYIFTRFPCLNQRDGLNRERILEHFLPISKQTPKPSASIKC